MAYNMTPYLSLDHLILYTFLIITLIVGIWAGKGIKTMREYAIANKLFGTGVLTMTMLATYIEGWNTIGFPGDIFADGLTHLVPTVLFGVVFCLLFIAKYIAPKLVHFHGCITMGDLMQQFYGNYARRITGLLGLIYTTTAVSIQLLFLGQVCAFLGIPSDYGLLVSSLILVTYASMGGIKSVTITDVVQFIVIVVAIPLLANLVIHEVGGIKVLLSKLPTEKLQLFNWGQEKGGAFSQGYYSFPILALWFLFPGFPLSFPFIQRMLMVRDARQAKNIYYLTTLFLVLFFALLTLIGLAAWVLYPTISSQEVMPHIISKLPLGLRGIVITGIAAVIMSSADSFLHAGGVSFTHDFIKPLCDTYKKPLNTLRVVRYITFLLGCLAITMALGINDLFKLAIYGMDLPALLFTVPLIAGIVGLKTDSRSFLVSLATTVVCFFATQLYCNAEIGIPICILANLLSFFGTHWVQNKGFLLIDRTAGITRLWKPSHTSIKARLKGLLDIIGYPQRKFTAYGAAPTAFAFFMGFQYMMPGWVPVAQPPAYNWLLAIRGVGALFCVGLLLKEYWPALLQRYFPLYWYSSLCYCLPFSTTLLFFLYNSAIEWLVHIVLAILLLIVLVDWLTFVILSLGGGLLGIIFAHYTIGLPIQVAGGMGYLLLYSCFFTTLAGFLFARRKQQQVDQLEASKQQLSNAYALSEKDRLHTLHHQAFQKQAINGKKHPLPWVKAALTRLTKQVSVEVSLAKKANDQLDAFFNYYKNSFYHSMDCLLLNVITISIEELLTMVTEAIQSLALQEKIRFQVTTQHKQITCDRDQMVQLLVTNLRDFASQKEYTGTPITLWVQDTTLRYTLQAIPDPNYTRELPAIAFGFTVTDQPLILPSVYPGNTRPVEFHFPKSISQLQQWRNERIIDAHYGHYDFIAAKQLIYVIPVDLRAIRSKVVDKMPIGRVDLLIEDVGSLALERAFLAQIAKKTSVDRALMQEVIDHIKSVHQGQYRKSGELFYTHPLAVAYLLLDMTQDPDAIIAALLHDVIEDTPLGLDQVAYQYGQEVAYIVAKVTNLDSTEKKSQLTAIENHQHLAAAYDPRVVMVKLADRLHNIRTLGFHSADKQQRIAQETLSFYLPLGRKLEEKHVEVKKVV
ncbi:MAG: HD domain-containing protein, partial [Amoebophilaceae bacterium]|nr:HD domain-containing protein [Amoebophilaceae bacterium]